ncbi:MAG: sensor histidine kinase [Phreatobacter sp.]|uniref:sensor histidine kinase n=1 Tax=Phreatobacter sp. TaxID=1966341 RepID=UPI004036D7B3
MTDDPHFLAGGGQMGALMRAHDWAATAFGRPSDWAAELKVLASFVLASPQPMMIWWGQDLLQIYNDAFAALMGPERHPGAFGAAAQHSWGEIWSILGPQVAHVLAGGEPRLNEEELIQITRFGARRSVWWTYGFSPIMVEGRVAGVVLTCQEVTARQRLTNRIRHQSERFQQLFEQAPGFIAFLLGPQHVFQFANAAYRALVGNRPLIGKPVADILPEASAQGFVERLDEVYRSGELHVGRRVPLTLADGDGTERDYVLDFIYQPIVDDDGQVAGVFIQGHDVTAHAAAEKNLTLINHELKHRVKNTLAVTTGIVNQTLRNRGNDELLATLRARISAYARAHDILAPQTWATGTVHGAVMSAVQTFRAQGGSFTIEGPDLTLGSRQVLSLALAVHELAVNARRYGALSHPTGSVDIRWTLLDPENEPKFEFTWKESGGPPCREPERHGFGLHLVSRVLAADFDATTSIAFPTSGLIFTMLALGPSLRPPDPDGFFAKL